MTLHTTLDQHEHDEKFLTLLGGLQSVLDRFDAILATHAPPRDTVASTAADPTITLLLGAIAIRDRLASAFAVEDSAARPVERPTLPQESLLR